MSTLLKQSTTVTIRLGPFLDITDGVTEEVGLGSMGIEVSKNHAAFGARNSATATAHDAEGWYSCELDTTDTGTLGPLIVKAHAPATHLPVWREFLVVPANVYDSLVAGSDALQVHANEITNGLITAAAIATGAIDADALAADAGTELADAILARALAAESYAADGAVPTLSQALYMLISGCLEFAISGTTITCKKLDGSTTSMTYTLDSSTLPTSRTRAT